MGWGRGRAEPEKKRFKSIFFSVSLDSLLRCCIPCCLAISLPLFLYPSLSLSLSLSLSVALSLSLLTSPLSLCRSRLSPLSLSLLSFLNSLYISLQIYAYIQACMFLAAQLETHF